MKVHLKNVFVPISYNHSNIETIKMTQTRETISSLCERGGSKLVNVVTTRTDGKFVQSETMVTITCSEPGCDLEMTKMLRTFMKRPIYLCRRHNFQSKKRTRHDSMLNHFPSLHGGDDIVSNHDNSIPAVIDSDCKNEFGNSSNDESTGEDKNSNDDVDTKDETETHVNEECGRVLDDIISAIDDMKIDATERKEEDDIDGGDDEDCVPNANIDSDIETIERQIERIPRFVNETLVWFFAAPVMSLLGFKNAKDAMKKNINKSERIRLSTFIKTEAQQQRITNLDANGADSVHPQTVVINHYTLLSLIYRSCVRKRDEICRWITVNIINPVLGLMMITGDCGSERNNDGDVVEYDYELKKYEIEKKYDSECKKLEIQLQHEYRMRLVELEFSHPDARRLSKSGI